MFKILFRRVREEDDNRPELFDQVILGSQDWLPRGQGDSYRKTRAIMAQSIQIPPEHLSFFFLRKAAIVQYWGQQIHAKTPEWGKRVKMPHPEDEVKGMLFSKRLKIAYWHAVRK